MANEKVECPNCEGNGVSSYPIDEGGGYFTSEGVEECPLCDGEGEVDEASL